MRTFFGPSFGALGLTLAVAFAACGGEVQPSADADADADATAPPPSRSEGSHADCTAQCPSLPVPQQEGSLCTDGTLAKWTCGGLFDGCGFVEQCPQNARQCFLANTLQIGGEPIPPDGGLPGQVNPSLRACTEATDCTSVEVTDDCCGTIHVAGVNKKHASTLAACASTRKAAHGSCQCAATTYADDRTMPTAQDAGADGGANDADAGGIHITCRFSQCTTTFSN